jgi:hypothetical protein
MFIPDPDLGVKKASHLGSATLANSVYRTCTILRSRFQTDERASDQCEGAGTNFPGWSLQDCSVLDPDSNPDPDSHVFGPPGSGSFRQMYGSESGSGSFYHQAKKIKKNLDSYCFVTSFGLFIFEKLCKCTFKK